MAQTKLKLGKCIYLLLLHANVVFTAKKTAKITPVIKKRIS